MTREEQLRVEGSAYLRLAQQHLGEARRGGNYARGVLDKIAAARDALHEAAARYAELQKLEDAADDELPW